MARNSKEVRIAASRARARAKWSKENSGEDEAGDSSFRIPYYGATEASVPFMWESQPGTPKHHMFSENYNFAPPLTPPPSYTYSFSPSPSPSPALARRKTRKPGFFSAFFSSFSRKNNRHTSGMSSSTSNSGPLSWSTSSSSSYPVSSPPRPSAAKSQSPLLDEDEEQKVGSCNKRKMCFGYNKQGCYSMLNVKNSVVSIKGH